MTSCNGTTFRTVKLSCQMWRMYMYCHGEMQWDAGRATTTFVKAPSSDLQYLHSGHLWNVLMAAMAEIRRPSSCLYERMV